MKIKIDQEKCIGCGSCVAVCSDVFMMKEEDNKAYFTDGKNEGKTDKPCAKEAVEVCPVQAILEIKD